METLVNKSGMANEARSKSLPRRNLIPELVGMQGSVAKDSQKYPASGLAVVSHELRNLLTALNLYSDLLAEPGVLTNPHRHMAEEIKLIAQAGKCLLHTLNRFPVPATSVSQMSASDSTMVSNGGGVVIEQANGILFEHQIAPVLDSCLSLLAHVAGPQVHVHLKCAKNHGCLPLSSEDLTLILVNLVRNAAEAMPSGGGIWISIYPAVVSGLGRSKHARIVVEDDGPGIPVRARAHLFESGYTTKLCLHNDQIAVREYHGLGLSIVRRQVESAGGAIHSRRTSKRGGARFEISIPFATSNVQPKLQISETTNCKERARGEGTRVRC